MSRVVGRAGRAPGRIACAPTRVRLLDRFEGHRAVATRYDKLAVRYEAAVLIAAINAWL
ncbi:hypothetical protein ACFU8Q_00675 [Streptomyces sp. NPDC057543]|uniref:hypothetical protein n=1 Tax=Streptomyces sp. NPDC057543 TaxID=3346163 RepID=UPI0036BEC7F0